MSSARDHDHPPFGFSTRMRVDFADTDAGGILYYGRFSHYVDRAVFDYRRAAGVPLLGEPGHLYVVRAMEMTYHAPLRFDDDLEAFVRTSRMGTTSHSFDVRIERIDADGALHVADARGTVVGVSSYDDPRPTPVPPALRAALEGFESRTH